MSYARRFALFGIWILVCSVLFYLIYEDARTKAIDDLNSRQRIHAKQAAAGIEALIDHWMAFLSEAAQKERIVDLGDRGRETLDFIYAIHNAEVTAITRVDAGGDIVYTTPYNEAAIGANLMHQDHIRRLFRTQRPAVSDVFPAVQGYDAIALHYPIMKDGAFAGSIGVLFDFRMISRRYLEVIHLGKTGYAWMTSAAGVELYCPVPGHVGNSVFENCKDFPTIIAMAEKMVNGEQGVTDYRFDSIRDKKVETIKKHAVYMPIQVGDNFWSIVVASSEEEILASLKGFRNKLLALFLLLLVGSMFFAFFVLRAWAVLKEEAKRKAVEEALRQSERRYRTLFEAAPISLWEQEFSDVKKRLDGLPQGSPSDLKIYLESHPDLVRELAAQVRIIDVNRATLKLYGAESKSELYKGLPVVFAEESYGDFIAGLVEISEGKTSFYFEKVHRTLQGDAIDVQLYWMVAPGHEATYSRVIVSIIDVTEYVRAIQMKEAAENQLRQSQKMEAIGTLAGGIAHDFNNILFPIIGYAEMTLESLPAGSPDRRNLEEILNAADRARDLVAHILTFSRKSEKQMKPLLIQPIVKETLKLLRSTIPTSIQFQADIRETGAVVADPTQIHQVMMNLCTNAYHAMQETGGLLRVIVGEAEVAPGVNGAPPDAAPGRYATIAVADTGAGIEKEAIDRIFEPYYTTKEQGKGTGLGLAVVHGIVAEHGGFITVESNVGKGSAFTLYFPVLEAAEAEAAAAPAESRPGGTERVLFVDDDKSIADMVRQMLVRMGYDVAVRYSSLDAMELFRNRPDDFDVVITDMTMPNMTGDRLARRIREIRPDIPVIICTGYSERIDPKKAREMGAAALLMKPVLKNQLSDAIRGALDKAEE